MVTCAVWRWPRPVHINILESSSVLRLLRSLALHFHSVRIVSLLDSNVSRCALSKGRSSARGLSQVSCRTAAIEVGFGLYPAFPFCPTRLMPADGPSRDGEPPEPSPSLDEGWTSGARLVDLQRMPRLQTWLQTACGLFCGFPLPCPRSLSRTAASPLSLAGPCAMPIWTLMPPWVFLVHEGPVLGLFKVFWVCFSSLLAPSHGMLQPT